VDSATPSMSPTIAVPAPRTLTRNSGMLLWSISDDASVRKLAAVATQTFLGSGARGVGGASAMILSPSRMFVWDVPLRETTTRAGTAQRPR